MSSQVNKTVTRIPSGIEYVECTITTGVQTVVAVDTPLTVGQVAVLLGCSHQSAIRVMDSGELHHYIIPDTSHRRCYLDDVLDLMRKYGIRIPIQLDDSAELAAFELSKELPGVQSYFDLLRAGLYLGQTRRLRGAFVGSESGLGMMYKYIDLIKEHHPHTIVCALYHDSELDKMGPHDKADIRLPCSTEAGEIVKAVTTFKRKRVR